MRRFFLLLAAFFSVISAVFSLPSASAAESKLTPLHWSGDKTFYDSRNNRMELIGHAAIHQNGESLFADHITYERDTKIVHAVGNAVMVGRAALIQGTEMHFNLETRTGTIVDGRVSTDQFTLSGERINKLGDSRFQAHRADYSTCKDCPQSWTLSAGDVDLEINGYAFLSNVTAKVMDAPGFWIPYLIVPIKTKRQTGLLIPQFGFNNGGLTFVQPFFWGINRSVDMTIGAGVYGGRGRRLEWEGRYALSKGSGKMNLYHIDDRTFRDYLANSGFSNNKDGFSSSRWAVAGEQSQEIFLGIQEKLRISEVSDSAYLSTIGDIAGNGEAYLSSDLSFSRSTDKVSSFLVARRYRNLMTQISDDPRAFDPKTVQIFPQVEVTSNDKRFFDDNLIGGISLGATNFTRAASFYDRDLSNPVTSPGGAFRPGEDPIREAIRVKMNPTLYSTFRAGDVVSIVPRANYHQYAYNFHGYAPSLTTSYLNLDVDISTQFERVIDEDPNSDIPKMKHLIRPLINYSVIPYRNVPGDHPFIKQMQYAQSKGFTGYNFDDEDIIPLDSTLNNANYFNPRGNALSYGFTTQLMRKRKVAGGEGAMNKFSYDTPIEWSAGQSFNFRELRKDKSQQPLSRFYSLITATFDKANGFVDYYYIPYQPFNENTSRHVYTVGGNWVLAKGTGRVLAYERSLGLSYSFNRSSQASQTKALRFNSIFSVNDWIMPGASVSYDMLGRRWQEANTTLTFQSPSECWKFDVGYYQNICPKVRPDDTGWCSNFRFNLSLNLTGSGFGGFTENKTTAAK